MFRVLARARQASRWYPRVRPWEKRGRRNLYVKMWLNWDGIGVVYRVESQGIKEKCCPIFKSIWLLWVSGLLVEMKGLDLNKAMSVMDGSWAVVGEWFHNYLQSYFSNYFLHCLLDCISWVLACVSWNDLAPMSSWEVLCLEPTSPPLFIWSTDGSLLLFDC